MKLTVSASASTATVPVAERVLLVRETIRAELVARGVVTRRWLTARVIDVLQVFAITEEEVAGAIDDLEDADDLVSGSHGRLAPTPLRVIDIGDGHLFVGTLPSIEWRHGQGPMLDEGRLPRRLSVHDDGVSDVIARFGGLRMPLARWAGLDRVAPANESWIAELDARLAMAPRPASDDNDSPWVGFAAVAAGPFRKRWRIPSTDGGTKLWRRFHRAGYSEYAWTNGSSPSASSWTALSGDEALRSIYSLTRAQPAELTVSVGVDATAVQISERVPHAEYRWLIGAATSAQDGTFLFPTARAAAARAMVRERLGTVPASEEPFDHQKTEH